MNDVIFKGIWVLLGIIMLRYYAKRKHTVKSAFSVCCQAVRYLCLCTILEVI